MRIFTPDFYKDFRCLAGACPDSCCRQGWQIVIDEPHRRRYEKIPFIREAMQEADGETVFLMKDGVCTLLRADGLCPIAAQYGEEALCHICHTHPRFIEEYGAEREIYFSFSCPEAARLALMRTKPICFSRSSDDMPVTQPNEIDAEQYLTLQRVRRLAIHLAQDRTVPLDDRLALLLRLGYQMQRYFDRRAYLAARRAIDRWYGADYRTRQLEKTVRLRRKKPSPFVFSVLRKTECLTDEMRVLLPLFFGAEEKSDFSPVQAEHFIVLELAHYIPKAVNDNDLFSKLSFAVFGWFFIRTLCTQTEKTAPEAVCHYAGLLAKELEHSEENMQLCYRAFGSEAYAVLLSHL